MLQCEGVVEGSSQVAAIDAKGEVLARETTVATDLFDEEELRRG